MISTDFQCDILRILDTHMQKKFLWSLSAYSELVESKFARNGKTNGTTYLTNICKHIIWHLLLVNPIKLRKSR
jgi:hypothetical protein